MCRRDLKTESFRGCQFPQSESKDESAGHLVGSRPSAPSFSSSPASELPQLSDSSSKSARQTTNSVTKCASLDSFALWMQVFAHDHFSPRHLVVKPARRLLISGSDQLSTLPAATGVLEWARSVQSAMFCPLPVGKVKSALRTLTVCGRSPKDVHTFCPLILSPALDQYCSSRLTERNICYLNSSSRQPQECSILTAQLE